MIVLGLLIGVSIYGVMVASRCFFRVGEGHLAVLTAFGAVERDASGGLRTWGPGLHRKRPWQKVVTVPTMEQSVELSGEKGGQMAMAEDGTVLRFDSILRYQPIESRLEEFLFGLRAPIEHITGLFTCLLRNEIANFRAEGMPSRDLARADLSAGGGAYALIRRERVALNRRIAEFCRTQIGDRYGVHFNAVDLTDILPPDELAEALNGMIQAQTEAEALYFRAQADCEQRVLASEQGIAIAHARAEAVETEVRTLGAALAALHQQGTLRDYVERRRAEVLSESRAVFVKDHS
jgi:regulator of protease activity HflC (stomatin/prohibitin superfamily)